MRMDVFFLLYLGRLALWRPGRYSRSSSEDGQTGARTKGEQGRDVGERDYRGLSLRHTVRVECAEGRHEVKIFVNRQRSHEERIT